MSVRVSLFTLIPNIYYSGRDYDVKRRVVVQVSWCGVEVGVVPALNTERSV